MSDHAQNVDIEDPSEATQVEAGKAKTPLQIERDKMTAALATQVCVVLKKPGATHAVLVEEEVGKDKGGKPVLAFVEKGFVTKRTQGKIVPNANDSKCPAAKLAGELEKVGAKYKIVASAPLVAFSAFKEKRQSENGNVATFLKGLNLGGTPVLSAEQGAKALEKISAVKTEETPKEEAPPVKKGLFSFK